MTCLLVEYIPAVQFKHYHEWHVTPQEAIKLQKELADKVIIKKISGKIKTVAGIDVGIEAHGNISRAAIVLLEYPSLVFIDKKISQNKTTFPYIPGLLSFREIPVILKVLDKLKSLPDLILCDGQGYAHPRRFGLACHLGVITDIPTIGVGKTRLIGTSKPPANKRGAWKPLIDNNETIGAVLRTRENVKPVYISIGHRVDLISAIDYVMNCTTRYKLPETTRMAHQYASGK